MTGYWYPTDQRWFDYLASKGDWPEVNYWQPNGWSAIGNRERGTPFFFKLKAPSNHVGGFGFFDRHPKASAQSAWGAFADANGAPDFETMLRRIEGYRGVKIHDPFGPYEIGCIMIQAPIFFPRELWIPVPKTWKTIGPVKGSQVDLETPENRQLWRQCLSQAHRLDAYQVRSRVSIAADQELSTKVFIPRRGQGPFRMALLDAYGQACAVTGEHSEPVLDAAHIRPYADDRTYEVSNGLLLRADIHRLFEQGFVGITPDFHFVVSSELKARWDNGHTYYELGDRVGKIRLPRNRADWPDTGLLEEHYRGFRR